MDPSLLDVIAESRRIGYLIVSLGTVWLWDLILSFSEEMTVFADRQLSIHDAVYALSRMSSGGLLVAALGFLSKTGPGCRSVLKAVDWFQVLSLIFNSSLFLFRVLAVFADFPTIKAGFIILWLSTFLALSIPFSSKLRDVAVCNIDEVHPLEAMGFIAVEVFDTAVFVAVSVQVLRSNITTSGHDRFAAFVTGDKLGQVSRVLLQTGQIYYLSTIGVNLLALSTLLVPGPWFSPMFKAGMTLVSVTMQNILTCKVVRLLRLGVIPNDPTSISVSIYGTVHFATRSDACQTTSVSASEDEVQRP